MRDWILFMGGFVAGSIISPAIYVLVIGVLAAHKVIFAKLKAEIARREAERGQ